MPIDINAARAAKAAKAADKPTVGKPPKSAPAPRPAVDPGAVPESRTSAKLADVAANPLNPRTINVDSEDMQELRADLKARGQMTPVPVVTAEHFRQVFADTPHAVTIGGADFVIVGGGRRHAALEANQAWTIKISVLHGNEAPATPADWLAATVAENIQREELSVMETARSVRDLREYNTGREVAAILRKSPGWVSLYMGLNDLPADVVALIESAPFSLRQARQVYDKSGSVAQLYEARKIRALLLGEDPPAGGEAGEAAPAPVESGTADDVTAPSKGGRKAHTPTQRLAAALGKLDREGIIEALAARFPGVDRATLAAVLAEPQTVHTHGEKSSAADQPA